MTQNDCDVDITPAPIMTCIFVAFFREISEIYVVQMSLETAPTRAASEAASSVAYRWRGDEEFARQQSIAFD
jgi:hypothetical protein